MSSSIDLDINKIVLKYIREKPMNKKERSLLRNWVSEGDGSAELLQSFKDPNVVSRQLAKMEAVDTNTIWDKVYEKIRYKNRIVTDYIHRTELSDPAPPQIVTDTRIINRALLDIVKKDLGHIYKMTPREFEFLVAELLEKKGYCVEITPETRDWGKDLVAVKNIDFGKFIFFVECKRYDIVKPVGIEVVQRLYGTVTGNATAGLIVTSSDFSAPAKSFTSEIEHQMSLVNYRKLCQWIME